MIEPFLQYQEIDRELVRSSKNLSSLMGRSKLTFANYRFWRKAVVRINDGFGISAPRGGADIGQCKHLGWEALWGAIARREA